ncbi:MAG TPA: hypothetical protein VGC11_14925 [Acidimicrobiia bacterium]
MAVELTRLTPAAAAAAVLRDADPAWARRFVDELDRAVRTEPLVRLIELWGLSNVAAARIFGVSRQAFTRWLRNGPPVSRAGAVADVASATDLLDRKVKRERIPAVVRRAAPVLGGRSLLELAEAGDTAAVARAVSEMFELRRVQA